MDEPCERLVQLCAEAVAQAKVLTAGNPPTARCPSELADVGAGQGSQPTVSPNIVGPHCGSCDGMIFPGAPRAIDCSRCGSPLHIADLSHSLATARVAMRHYVGSAWKPTTARSTTTRRRLAQCARRGGWAPPPPRLRSRARRPTRLPRTSSCPRAFPAQRVPRPRTSPTGSSPTCRRARCTPPPGARPRIGPRRLRLAHFARGVHLSSVAERERRQRLLALLAGAAPPPRRARSPFVLLVEFLVELVFQR